MVRTEGESQPSEEVMKEIEEGMSVPQRRMTNAQVAGLEAGKRIAKALDPDSKMSETNRSVEIARMDAIREGLRRGGVELASPSEDTDDGSEAGAEQTTADTATVEVVEQQDITEATAPEIESVEAQAQSGELSAEEVTRVLALVHKYLEENKDEYGYPLLYKKLYEAKYQRPHIVESNISNYLKDNNEQFGYPVLYNELYKAGYEREEIVDTVVRHYLQDNASNVTEEALTEALLASGFTQDEIGRNKGGMEFRLAEQGATGEPAPVAPQSPIERNAAAEQGEQNTVPATAVAEAPEGTEEPRETDTTAEAEIAGEVPQTDEANHEGNQRIAMIQKYLSENKDEYGYPRLFKKLYEASYGRTEIIESIVLNYLHDNYENSDYPALYNELYKAGFEREEIVDTVVKHYLQENANSFTENVLDTALLEAGYTQTEIDKNKEGVTFSPVLQDENGQEASRAIPAPTSEGQEL